MWEPSWWRYCLFAPCLKRPVHEWCLYNFRGRTLDCRFMFALVVLLLVVAVPSWVLVFWSAFRSGTPSDPVKDAKLQWWQRKSAYIGALVFVVLAWIACPILVKFFLLSPGEAGAFGDIFGVINSLFAGLAFFGLLVTILQQRQELRRQESAHAEQARLMRVTAALTALPSLILAEKQFISSNDSAFKKPEQINFTSADYFHAAETLRQELHILSQPSRPLGQRVPYPSANRVHFEIVQRKVTLNRLIHAYQKLGEYTCDMEILYAQLTAEIHNPGPEMEDEGT